MPNTGGPPGGDPLGFTREQWEQAHRELVVAPIELIELVVPGMREHGFGRADAGRLRGRVDAGWWRPAADHGTADHAAADLATARGRT